MADDKCRDVAVLGTKSMGVKALTLAISMSAHAAAALIAAHGASVDGDGTAPANVPAPELVIIEAPSLEPSPAEPARAGVDGARAQHTHPYPVSPDHEVTPHDPRLPHLPVRDRSAASARASEPSAVEMPASAPVRFVMTLGRQPIRASSGSSAIESESGTSSSSSAAWAEGAVDTAATLLSGAAPAYTREAQNAGVEADVPLEIVIDEKGSVVDARAVRQVGYGLDEVALRSIRGYRFRPARRAGQSVSVRMRWVIRFELR